MSPEDPQYQRWLASCATECICCGYCSPVLCGGVSAGWFCDELCWCEDPDDDSSCFYDDEAAE